MQGLVELKAYLYATLSADASLISLMGGANIYDLVQKNAILPYVSFDNVTSMAVQNLDAQVVEHTMIFTIAAKADSSLTSHNIMARLETIFEQLADKEDLTAGFRLLAVKLTKTRIEQVDFDVVKGRMEVEFLIEGDV